MGDPDQGVGPQQPGGWIYTTSPFLEDAALMQVGQGLSWGEKKRQLAFQMQHVIPTFNCPTRRSAVGLSAFYPDDPSKPCDNQFPRNSELPPTVAKTDYAIHGGSGRAPGTPDGNECAAESCLGGAGNELNPGGSAGSYPNCNWHTGPAGREFNFLSQFSGISTFRTGARLAQVVDGTSKTALVGEKFVEPRFYDGGCGGQNGGDNSSMYQGYDWDNTRWAQGNPAQDEDFDAQGHGRFGSAHPGGFQLALCDGSVDTVDYDIDTVVWGSMVHRNDGD